MSNLHYEWENNHDAFECLTKKAFDKLCNEKQFIQEPVVSNPSKWMSEFGPYDPHQWAFGQLTDGRFVCCNVAAEAAGGES